VGQTRIVLVRHGESQAQEQRVVGGHAGCTGLSDLGKRQVTALRDRLAATGELAGATALYSSILPRAVQTAQILAPALGDLDIEQDCDFCEGHAGAGDGLRWEEFEQRWPVPADWTPDTRRDPGSETFAEMQARVTTRLDALAARHDGETVVVACHGGVVLHSMFRWLQIAPIGGRTRAWLDPINSSMTEWRMADLPSWKAGVELVRFNDHGHLTGELLPPSRRP
jgi:probable phosphoglycerate mutase